MKNSIKSNYTINQISANEHEIAYKRAWALGLTMAVIGFALTITLIGWIIGLPLLIVGGIAGFRCRKPGSLIVAGNEGIKYKGVFGGMKQIPFSEITRVGWMKHPMFPIYSVFVDTGGKTVYVAAAITSEAVARDLQQLILEYASEL